MNAESLKGKFFRKRNYIKIKDELPESILDFRRRYVFLMSIYIILIKHLDAYHEFKTHKDSSEQFMAFDMLMTTVIDPGIK
ncbi:hypothetical protein AGMMS50229_19930 [Campylobacterota bacterium]|nr:hypothetical protein AGMMS50229_19930 [Campylobacterota bacterium]